MSVAEVLQPPERGSWLHEATSTHEGPVGPYPGEELIARSRETPRGEGHAAAS